jgi:hypothetical protein
MLTVLRTLALALVVMSCAGDDTHRADTNQTGTAHSPGDSGLPSGAKSLLDSLKQRVERDTSAPAYKQLDLMTAPLDVLPLNAFESDTLQWVARTDSCAMVVRSFGPTGRKTSFGSSWISVAEGSGTIGPGSSIDVSPSPDWKQLAYTSSVRLPADSTRWKTAVEGVTLSFEDVRRVAQPRADGSLWVTFAVVEPPSEECAGDGCPTPLVSPAFGGWRIGWTADSRYLLLASRGDSSHWTAIDPTTRQPVAGDAKTPHQLNWSSQSVAAAMDSPRTIGITGGGPYRFTSRGDSIVVHGPDRNGRLTDRVVGAGVPVAVTQNGQYLLAVRQEKARVRAVIYAFRLFHAMIRSSCDQPH